MIYYVIGLVLFLLAYIAYMAWVLIKNPKWLADQNSNEHGPHFPFF